MALTQEVITGKTQILVNANECRAANNRAYYAVFHAIPAIHALDAKAYKEHKDAIGNFNKDYIKTGICPKEIGKRFRVQKIVKTE